MDKISIIKMIRLFLFSCLHLLIVIKPQFTSSNSIVLDKQISKNEGRLESGQKDQYYTKIADNKDLQIRAYAKEGTLVSPRLFVSLKQQPTSPNDSDFYTNSIGNDYILLHKDSVKLDQIVYISVYCEKECQYVVEIKYDDEIEISIDNFYTFSLKKNTDILLKFKTPASGFELSMYSPENVKFKPYIEKSRHPDKNSMLLKPSFIGGFGIELTKDSGSLYCSDCTYYVLIIFDDSEITNGQIIVNFNRIDLVQTLSEKFPAFNIVSEGNRRCYKFTVGENGENVLTDSLISSLTVFSGVVQLDINPGKYVEDQRKALYVYDVPISLVKRHNATELDFYDFREVYYCVTGISNASYMIKAIMESDIEKIQTYNFLVDGIEIPGYLPASKVMRYRVVDLGKSRNTFLILKVWEGRPKLMGFLCNDLVNCYLNPEDVRNSKFNKNFYFPSEYSGDFTLQTVWIEDYSKNCNGNNCALNAVVFCDGQDECIYDILFNFENSSTLLKEK